MNSNADQDSFLSKLRTFLRNQIKPKISSVEENGVSKGEILEIIRDVADLGLGPAASNNLMPFFDPVRYAEATEEISRVWPSLSITLMGCFPCPLIKWSSSKSKEAYRSSIESGELIGCLGITEPESGSDSANPETTAEKNGNYYVLNGTKTWISNAPIADIAIISAHDVQTDDTSFFLIDRETSNFKTDELAKLGWKGSPTGQMFLENCMVHEDNKLSSILSKMASDIDLSDSILDLQGLLSREKPLNVIFAFVRTGMSAMATGISRACYEISRNYVKDYIRNGETLENHQFMQKLLYETKSIVKTSKLLTQKAARLVNEASEDARLYSSLAKGFSCEKCNQAASNAFQIVGKEFLQESCINRLLRDARMMSIPDGTTEIQKLIVGYELTHHSAYTSSNYNTG